MGHVFVGDIFACRIGQDVNKMQRLEGKENDKGAVMT